MARGEKNAYIEFTKKVRNTPQWKHHGALLRVPDQGRLLGLMYRKQRRVYTTYKSNTSSLNTHDLYQLTKKVHTSLPDYWSDLRFTYKGSLEDDTKKIWYKFQYEDWESTGEVSIFLDNNQLQYIIRVGAEPSPGRVAK